MPSAKRKPASRPIHHPASPLAPQQPLVSARWLLWCLAGIFAAGLLLVYLTTCLLFWQGQWQILYHPDHPATIVPQTLGLPYQDIRFDATEAGRPQLDGWFIPAAPGAPYAHRTILYLHSMKTGSLVDAIPELSTLHQLGIAIFAFDYRGFGQSRPLHPSAQSTSQDAESAWQYITGTRHIPAASVTFYGVELGASLAIDTAARHPDAAGLVLDTPVPTALTLLRDDPRSHGLPIGLLARDRYDSMDTIGKIHRPLLFLLPPPPLDQPGRRLAQQAAASSRYDTTPSRRIVSLPASGNTSLKLAALRRYFDELPSTPPASGNP